MEHIITTLCVVIAAGILWLVKSVHKLSIDVAVIRTEFDQLKIQLGVK